MDLSAHRGFPPRRLPALLRHRQRPLHVQAAQHSFHGILPAGQAFHGRPFHGRVDDEYAQEARRRTMEFMNELSSHGV